MGAEHRDLAGLLKRCHLAAAGIPGGPVLGQQALRDLDRHRRFAAAQPVTVVGRIGAVQQPLAIQLDGNAAVPQGMARQ